MIDVIVIWSGGNPATMPSQWDFTASGTCNPTVGSVATVGQILGKDMTVVSAPNGTGCSIGVAWVAVPGWTDITGTVQTVIGGNTTQVTFTLVGI